eukprot:1189149-Prorocentrum_minimum.AAC.2
MINPKEVPPSGPANPDPQQLAAPFRCLDSRIVVRTSPNRVFNTPCRAYSPTYYRPHFDALLITPPTDRPPVLGIPSSEYVRTHLPDFSKTGAPEGRQTPSARKSVHDAVVTLAKHYQAQGFLPPALVSVSATVPERPRNSNNGRNGPQPHKWTYTEFVLLWAT